MPEGRSKVIHYSDLLPRYILMAVATAFVIWAFCAKIASAETNLTGLDNGFNSDYVSPAVIDPIHELIDRHVRAIRARNADRAYHLISLTQQESYGTAKEYWRDVRDNMRLLFNHRSYKFLGQNQINGMIIQKVSMTDPSGKENLVIFRVKQNDANMWRIENVIVTSSSDDRA